ncbi:hypothetical protein [Streptomyces sp. SID8352]|uniref:hypothetical protein n=1 Tax=Streptomyces sp. SID8352 TaxID=2690338 RepID=UPI00136E6FFF|nr:hypothetical protein [Streptomyces sp. SID8352]MYU20497.1 hypothetical protein [Streptomyces sp. SID8352]
MAQDSWPSPEHNARFVNDVEYEQMARYFTGSGVYGSPADPAVVTAGVGLTVKIRPNQFACVNGHGWTSGTTGDILDVDANPSGQTRIDRAVLRLSRTTWTVRAVVKKGTPGAGPPPLATGPEFPNYESLLANINVPPSALSVQVIRGERYVGRTLRVATSTAQTNPNPEIGDLTWESDTKRLRLYDGARTITLYEAAGTVVVTSAQSGWAVEADSALDYAAGQIHLRLGTFKRTGGEITPAAESRLPVLIPAVYRHPTRSIRSIAYVSGARPAAVTIHAANETARAGQVWLTSHPTISAGDLILPGQVSWAVN